MKSHLLLATAAACLVTAAPAHAGVTYEVTEQAGDVVFEFSGSINLASTLGKHGDRHAYLNDFEGDRTFIRSVAGEADDYNVDYTIQASFNGEASGGTRAGDNFSFENVDAGSFHQVWLPNNYVSGDPISGSLTFSNTDFASLGLTPGIFYWEWANNSVTDFVRVQVGAVPEPTSALCALFAGVLTTWQRRRRATL